MCFPTPAGLPFPRGRQEGPVDQVCPGSRDSEIWKVTSSFLTHSITCRQLLFTALFLRIMGLGSVEWELTSPKACAMLSTSLLSLMASETQKHLSVEATITKSHRLDGISNRNIFFHSSGVWKSEIQVWVGLIAFWGLSPWLEDGCLFPPLYMVIPLCFLFL